jgi:predicted homoserine dehydrogenase-like protein
MPAATSLKAGALPIGLAHRVKLKNDIAHGAVVRWDDVEIDAGQDAVKTRRAMEAKFRKAAAHPYYTPFTSQPENPWG